MKKSTKKKIKLIFEKSEKKGGFAGKIYRKVIDRKRDNRFSKFADLEIDENLVVFECFMGRKYTDSPKAIYEYMLGDDKYSDYRFVWCFRDANMDESKALEGKDRTTIVRWGSEEYYKTYATAKYWVTNARLPKAIKNKASQVYVQTWHGTPLKRLGCDIVTEATEDMETTRRVIHEDAKRYTYLISPSAFCSDCLTSAFDLKVLGKESVVLEIGYPRNDAIVNHTDADVRRVKDILNIPENKKVILYAPTYRENQRREDKSYEHNETLDFESLKEKFGDEYVVLFRAHYYIANAIDYAELGNFVINVSDYQEINDLYIISDLLITDYSSVLFDYGILRRPEIFYMYDLEFYKDELRGFYMDTEELPGPIVRTQEDLEEKLKTVGDWTRTKEYENKYDSFAKKFNANEDGCSSERAVKEIFKN